MAMTRKQLARLDGHTSKSTGRCDCKTYALAYAVFCCDECVLLSTVMFERLAQEKVTSFVSHGSGAQCLFGFLLQVMAAQTLPSTQADQQSSRERIDERHYRKMGAFSGTNWKDWSFQSRSATKSSSMDAYKQALRVGGTRNHRDRGQSCPLLAVFSTQNTFFVSTLPDENTDRKRTMDLFLLSLHLSTRHPSGYR